LARVPSKKREDALYRDVVVFASTLWHYHPPPAVCPVQALVDTV
jgi:hypothetical protein